MMGLILDEQMEYRGPAARRRLIESVYQATPGTSEPEWLEWKSSADLTHARWHYEIARFVLGCSNREPNAARRFAAGYGYLLLGVEPGHMLGVACPVHADIETWVSAFLGGADGPRWDFHEVDLSDEIRILVVVAEPPPHGHGPFALAKGSEKAESGAVFIRRPGKTDRANFADMQMLNRRAAPVAESLSCSVLPSADSQVARFDATQSEIDGWLRNKRQNLLAQGANLPRSNASVLGFPADLIRTRTEYEADVDRYCEEARRCLPAASIANAIRQDIGGMTLVAINPSMQNLSDVVIEVDIPQGVFVGVSTGDVPHGYLPVEPDASSLKSREPFLHYAPFLRPNVPPIRSRPTIAQRQDGSTIRYPSGHLRPGGESALDKVYLYTLGAAASASVTIIWRATATNRDGIASGSFDLPVLRRANLVELATADD